MNVTQNFHWSTWSEILSQPATWRGWATSANFAEIQDWIASQSFDQIWCCGAGTSAYIGDILAAGLEGKSQLPVVRSVPTTDLVARPQAYLNGSAKPLILSFGRSGNSSETIATLAAIEALAPATPQLNITCNPDSALAVGGGKNHKTIVLPASTHDSGFAMTNSFSTMLFTALAVLDGPGEEPEEFFRAADEFDRILPTFQREIGSIPQRVVFLGTGVMAFAAREAALKIMELSAGQIPGLWDSTLGFRHGPKSFVTPETRIVLFTCGEHPASAYESDLATELRDQFSHTSITTIGPNAGVDLRHPDGVVWAAPNAVLFAQLAGVIWADALGLNVDDPFAGQGTLSRVVSGVRLYEISA